MKLVLQLAIVAMLASLPACGSDDASGQADGAPDNSGDGGPTIDGGTPGDGGSDGGNWPPGAHVIQAVELLAETPSGCAPNSSSVGKVVIVTISADYVEFDSSAGYSECARDGTDFDCPPDDSEFTWDTNTLTRNWDTFGELGDGSLTATTETSFDCTGPDCEARGEQQGASFPCELTSKRTYVEL